MKIISKYKDYYDYLGGVYGVDPKLILDRRSFDEYIINENTVKKDYPIRVSLSISDIRYDGVAENRDGNIFYHFGDSRDQFGVDKKLSYWQLKDGCEKDSIYLPQSKKQWSWYEVKRYPKPTDINQKENCPIVLTLGYYSWRDETHYKFPTLSELKIASILPPEDIWIHLSNWLAKRNEKVIEDKLTDIQKIETKGFDKKKSFRKMDRNK